MIDDNEQQIVPTISTVNLRNHSDTLRMRRRSHTATSLRLSQQQSIGSSNDDSFYDCQQAVSSPTKTCAEHVNESLMSVSTCTMTGQSLNNLIDSSLAQEKTVQTRFQSPLISIYSIDKASSSATLSSTSSTSIPTDSLELHHQHHRRRRHHHHHHHHHHHRQSKTTSILTTSVTHKWPHIYERLLDEQACIYWVNYLGSR
jgi:hypothetical protein